MKHFSKKRRLRKEIREAITTIVIGAVMAILLNVLIFGAAFQEQDRLTQEVTTCLE